MCGLYFVVKEVCSFPGAAVVNYHAALKGRTPSGRAAHPPGNGGEHLILVSPGAWWLPWHSRVFLAWWPLLYNLPSSLHPFSSSDPVTSPSASVRTFVIGCRAYWDDLEWCPFAHGLRAWWIDIFQIIMWFPLKMASMAKNCLVISLCFINWVKVL